MGSTEKKIYVNDAIGDKDKTDVTTEELVTNVPVPLYVSRDWVMVNAYRRIKVLTKRRAKSKVWLAHRRSDSRPTMLKFFVSPMTRGDAFFRHNGRRLALMEAAIMETLHGVKGVPEIVQTHWGLKLYSIEMKLPGKMTNLSRMLREANESGVADQLLKCLVLQFIEAAEGMAERGFVHADPKPNEFLIDRNTLNLTVISFKSVVPTTAQRRKLAYARAPCIDTSINAIDKEPSVFSIGLFLLGLIRKTSPSEDCKAFFFQCIQMEEFQAFNNLAALKAHPWLRDPVATSHIHAELRRPREIWANASPNETSTRNEGNVYGSYCVIS